MCSIIWMIVQLFIVRKAIFLLILSHCSRSYMLSRCNMVSSALKPLTSIDAWCTIEWLRAIANHEFLASDAITVPWKCVFHFHYLLLPCSIESDEHILKANRYFLFYAFFCCCIRIAFSSFFLFFKFIPYTLEQFPSWW